MHSKSDNKEIMHNDKENELIIKLFLTLLNRYQKISKNRWEVMSLSSTVFIHCIINVKK